MFITLDVHAILLRFAGRPLHMCHTFLANEAESRGIASSLIDRARTCMSSVSLVASHEAIHHALFFVSALMRDQLFATAVLSSAARTPLASFSASSLAQKCMKKTRGC